MIEVESYATYCFYRCLPDEDWSGGRQYHSVGFDGDDFEPSNSWEWERLVGFGYVRVTSDGLRVSKQYAPRTSVKMRAYVLKDYGRGRRAYGVSMTLSYGVEHRSPVLEHELRRRRFRSISEILAWAEGFLASKDFEWALQDLRRRMYRVADVTCVYRQEKDGQWVPFCSCFEPYLDMEHIQGSFYLIHPDGRESSTEGGGGNYRRGSVRGELPDLRIWESFRRGGRFRTHGTW